MTVSTSIFSKLAMACLLVQGSWSCPYKSGPPKRPVLFLLDTVLVTASSVPYEGPFHCNP
jgi:hypothetical protein